MQTLTLPETGANCPVVYYKGKALRPMAGGDGTVDQIAEKVLAQIGRQVMAGGSHRPGDNSWVRAERAVSGTPSALSYMGPGSLFGALGLERDVISTRMQPFGLADMLPVQLTNTLWPQFPYFTGFAAATGSEPVGVCDDPPTAGAGATCIQTAQFGRFSRQSRVLDVSNMRARINRAEMTDLSLLNGPLVGGMGGLTIPGSTGTGFNIMNEAYMRMVEIGVEFQTWFARQLYEGNPANNTGGNGYREFPGLDILVSTGHIDANTSVICPSLDSSIINFAYGNVSLTPAAMTNFINGLTQLMRYMRTKAAGQQMPDTQWALVMRPGLFYELTAAWPCNYATYRCAGNNGALGSNVNVNVDGMDMAQMRDAMRTGSYLTIDGTNIPVIQDNMLREQTNGTNGPSVVNGSLASDVYLLPLAARGRALLYWELFDFREGLGDLAALAPQLGGAFYWTDEGRYLWHLKPPNNMCVQVMGMTHPRIILRTPQFAARITNVQYQTVMHEPDADPAGPYFVRGGNDTGYAAPVFHAQWDSGVVS